MILHVSKSTPRIPKFFLTNPPIYATIKRVIRGRHPSEKTEITAYAKSNTKGATPIEKNVIVVDEQGNEYEATYPKRAKGLVKNGRARFVAENKICLACPPNENLEDKNMSENMNNIAAEATAEIKNTEITAEYALAQIEKILADTQHIYEALYALRDVQSKGPGDLGAQGVAQGIADVIRCRETTNQQLIAFYQNMYEDLKKEKATAEIDPSVRQQFLDFVLATTTTASPANELPDFSEIWNTVFLGK